MKKDECTSIVTNHLKGQPEEIQEAFKWYRFYLYLKATGVELKNEMVDINDMTPNTWNKMSGPERDAWTNYHALNGLVSFHCLSCGFPTACGTVGCEACSPIEDKS